MVRSRPTSTVLLIMFVGIFTHCAEYDDSMAPQGWDWDSLRFTGGQPTYDPCGNADQWQCVWPNAFQAAKLDSVALWYNLSDPECVAAYQLWSEIAWSGGAYNAVVLDLPGYDGHFASGSTPPVMIMEEHLGDPAYQVAYTLFHEIDHVLWWAQYHTQASDDRADEFAARCTLWAQ